MTQLKRISTHSSSNEIRIFQISDMHLFADRSKTVFGLNTENEFNEILKLAKNDIWPPDLILLTGDLAQDGESKTYTRLRQTLRNFSVPCLWLNGNHDNAEVMQSLFSQDDLFYHDAVFIKDWQIICLDSTIPNEDGGNLSEKELTKLNRLLQEQPDKNTLIALHHPPITVGSHWLDTMVLSNSDEFFSLISPHRQIKAVVCGHIHQIVDRMQNGVRILGLPSTCFQFKPFSDEFALDDTAGGYRSITLLPNGAIQTDVKRLQKSQGKLNMAVSGY